MNFAFVGGKIVTGERSDLSLCDFEHCFCSAGTNKCYGTETALFFFSWRRFCCARRQLYKHDAVPILRNRNLLVRGYPLHVRLSCQRAAIAVRTVAWRIKWSQTRLASSVRWLCRCFSNALCFTSIVLHQSTHCTDSRSNCCSADIYGGQGYGPFGAPNGLSRLCAARSCSCFTPDSVQMICGALSPRVRSPLRVCLASVCRQYNIATQQLSWFVVRYFFSR
mgnify:CR=1 FL=1